jgi:hypothetical protein
MQSPRLQKNCEFRLGALDSRYPNLVQLGQHSELRIAPGRDTAPGFFIAARQARCRTAYGQKLRGMGQRREEFVRSRPVIFLLLTGKAGNAMPAALLYSRSSRNGVPS